MGSDRPITNIDGFRLIAAQQPLARYLIAIEIDPAPVPVTKQAGITNALH
jgi:hypothetical protein